MADTEKLVFMVLHGPSHPEHATIPFVMAGAPSPRTSRSSWASRPTASSSSRTGGADAVEAPGFPPLKKLMDDVRELGGKLLVCGPCLKSRGITADDLVDGAEVVAAGRFVAEITSATNSLVY